MSVLSFIEIFYFFTIRLYKHYKDIDAREKRRQEMIRNGGHIVKKKIKYGESFYDDQPLGLNPNLGQPIKVTGSSKTIILREFIQ